MTVCQEPAYHDIFFTGFISQLELLVLIILGFYFLHAFGMFLLNTCSVLGVVLNTALKRAVLVPVFEGLPFLWHLVKFGYFCVSSVCFSIWRAVLESNCNLNL